MPLASRLLLAGALALVPLEAVAQSPTGLPAVLPAELETRMALAAAPPWLRDGAGVYLLGPRGYALARESSNGFVCIIERSAAPDGPSDPPERQTFAPQCYDEIGHRSHVALLVERSRLQRAEGMSERESLQAVMADPDRFRAAGTGVVYMASALNTLLNPSDPSGPFINYVPHVMFLAPDRSDASVSGGVGTDLEGFLTGWPFHPGPARVNGLIIVPLDRTLQAAIRADQQELLRELRTYLPVEPVEMEPGDVLRAWARGERGPGGSGR